MSVVNIFASLPVVCVMVRSALDTTVVEAILVLIVIDADLLFPGQAISIIWCLGEWSHCVHWSNCDSNSRQRPRRLRLPLVE